MSVTSSPGPEAATSERLVCVGDSFTEGMSDVLRPDGFHTGWADRVAVTLARQAADRGGALAYANLAVRGKLLDQVVADQLPVAGSYRPTLLTFHAGPNDVLRSGTRLEDLVVRYDAAVATAAAGTDRLVLFTSIGRAGGTGRLARYLAERFARFNEAVRETAARHGAELVDLEPVAALTDRRVWHVDRLHLNAEGHARVAAAVLERLGVADERLAGGPPGWWQEPLPPGEPVPRRAALATDVEWVRRYLGPWLGRRLRGVSSGDGLAPKEPVLRPVTPP